MFIKNIKYYLLLLAALVLVYSCGDPITPPKVNTMPVLIQLSSEENFVGDTLTIIGENFGVAGNQSFVLINGNDKVLSTECIEWSNRFIRFELKNADANAEISVVRNNDTSNKLEVIIGKLAPIATEEIPAGKFVMGSAIGSFDEIPTHEVEITNAFLMMKYEVSQKLYSIVTGKNPSQHVNPAYPVEGLSWLDAIKFCNDISALQEMTPFYEIKADSSVIILGGTGWRLPTEAEWEYACRAGTTGDYSIDGSISSFAWYNANSGYSPHTIGLKAENPFKLNDIHGNVWEWCWDFYSDDYYSLSPAQNPTGPNSGTRHVARGGAYYSGNARIRSSNRQIDFTQDFKGCGLRLVRNKN